MFTKIKTNQNYVYTSKSWSLYMQDFILGFFDIETTGLSPNQDHFILGGLLCQKTSPDGEAPLLAQAFASNTKEERDCLEEYISLLAQQEIWVSYNGDSFDIPFIFKRMRRLGISDTLPFHYSFDLYRVLRQSSVASLLPNLKQKTVEAFLNLQDSRTDQISGKESVLLYEQYLKHPSQELEQLIRLHNQDDVFQLAALLKILDKLDLHHIMFQRGFLCASEDKKAKIEQIHFDKGTLYISGTSKNILQSYQSYEMTHHLHFDAKNQSFELHIPYLCEKDFLYLDLEAFGIDFSPIERYNGYQSGYLVLRDGNSPNYMEINHTLKIFLKEILKQL